MSEEDNRLLSNRVLLSITLLFSLMSFIAITGSPEITTETDTEFKSMQLAKSDVRYTGFFDESVPKDKVLCNGEVEYIQLISVYGGEHVDGVRALEDGVTCKRTAEVTRNYFELYGFKIFDWKAGQKKEEIE